MISSVSDQKTIRHVVAVPFPGRGHINPLLHFCKLIASNLPNMVVTFIVTEEWHGFLSSEIRPVNLHLTSIPQVIPSEIGRAKNWSEFIRATMTKMEEPVEQLLDRLVKLPKPCVIIHDIFMKWVIGIGSRRNIPMASFYTQSATVFLIFYHFDLLVQHGHSNVDVAEKGEEVVDYIPGVAPIRLADLPTVINGRGKEIMPKPVENVSMVSKSQFLLLASTYELEAQAIDQLRKIYSIPVYSIGPAIPYWEISPSNQPLIADNKKPEPDYMKWLDAQPSSSVLYISQGSFLSVSSAQMDEIVAGVYNSGVRFFWIAHDEEIQSMKEADVANGIVMPWCNQLRVLSHSSVGGFWSHCGWNSTKEGLFAGLPMLCFPISFDQVTNTKQIVEDWKTGWRVKMDDGNLITREEIAILLNRFMDLESDEGKEMRRRAKKLQDVCVKAVENGGTSNKDLDAFCEDITIYPSLLLS